MNKEANINLLNGKLPNISVVIPCRNEEKYISGLLDSILAQDYPKERTEAIIADGMSNDSTRKIIAEYVVKHGIFRLIDNPQKIVPTALNAAIKLSKGEIIIRLDAHCVYPVNYFSELVRVLLETGADNVGAMWETLPGADTLTAQAIAIAISHPFGVGNAVYRTQTNRTEPFEVDTVPFGCFKRSVFDRIGYFDEELVRNQDNEFNERLLKNGGKIVLIPTLKLKYFARENYVNLWKMFYQYGLYGPLVDKKLQKPTRLRRYIPSIFVSSLILPLVASVLHKNLRYLTFLSAGLYALCASVFSLIISYKKQNPLLLPFLWLAFLVSHLSYGIGYFAGLNLVRNSGNVNYQPDISR